MYGPIDPRDEQLAQVLLYHSTKAKKGEVVLIQGIGLETLGLCSAVAWEAARIGAAPFIKMEDESVTRGIFTSGNDDTFAAMGKFELAMMKNVQCFIGIRGSANAFEMSGIPRKTLTQANKLYRKPVQDQRVNHTRWVVLRYPNSAMAQLAQMSRGTFADFYYEACCTDYAYMAKAVKPLHDLMRKTSDVHIKAPGTDLRMSIKGIGVIPCTGSHNIPDGEIFTAPIKDSVNGVVQYNTPSVYEGKPFDNIRLVFKDGKVVDASAASPQQTKDLNGILDQDPGARYIGEFAIGFHPFVKYAMRDILFDEKVCGSFHMALGQAYEDADNTNRSVVHWDMVQIQRKDTGGGEIWFDGKLIRKDGLFVPAKLQGLNPDAFIAKAKAKSKK